MSSLYHGSMGSRFYRWRLNVFTLSWIHGFAVLQMTLECLHSIMDPWVRGSTDDAWMSSLYHGSMGSRFFRWCRNVFILSWIHGFAVLQMMPECLHSIMDPWVRGSTDDAWMSSLYHGSMGSRFFRWCRNVFTLSWIHGFAVPQRNRTISSIDTTNSPARCKSYIRIWMTQPKIMNITWTCTPGVNILADQFSLQTKAPPTSRVSRLCWSRRPGCCRSDSIAAQRRCSSQVSSSSGHRVWRCSAGSPAHSPTFLHDS